MAHNRLETVLIFTIFIDVYTYLYVYIYYFDKLQENLHPPLKIPFVIVLNTDHGDYFNGG